MVNMWQINFYFISVRKVNSEYRAKFLSPAQYFYKAGTWTHLKENIPDQVRIFKTGKATFSLHLCTRVSFHSGFYLVI